MRYLLTAAAYVAAFVVVAAFTFGALMGLANSPHVAWLVSYGLDGVVLVIVGWVVVLVLPVLVARYVWNRLGRKALPHEHAA